MAQDWLGGLAVASRAIALHHCIIVDREPWRVDPNFDEMADANVHLQNRVRNLEVVGVLSVHLDAVGQGVAVGKLLGLEVLLEVHGVILPGLRRGR